MNQTHSSMMLGIALVAFVTSGYSQTNGVPVSASAPYVEDPYAGMFGSMGNVYSPYYRQFHSRRMAVMAGSAPMRGLYGEPIVPYSLNPYEGMFGSMGNTYSPYYRQFHAPGMSGMTGVSAMPEAPYVVNPYGGMFGSMGNVYSPYYRRFHTPGMSGMVGPVFPVSSGGGNFYRSAQPLYPVFMAPTYGSMSGMNPASTNSSQ